MDRAFLGESLVLPLPNLRREALHGFSCGAFGLAIRDLRFASRPQLGVSKSNQIISLSDSDRLISLFDLAAAPSESFGDEVPQRLSWSATERLGDLATPRLDDPTTSATRPPSDSPTRRLGDPTTRSLGDLATRPVSDSASRWVSASRETLSEQHTLTTTNQRQKANATTMDWRCR